MIRSLLGLTVTLVAAGQLFIATGARADETKVVVQRTASQPQSASPPVVATQPQPVETAKDPAGAEVAEERGAAPNTMLIGSGILVFGVSYGASALVAGTSNHPGDSHLYVPVLGPWMDLANRGDCGPTFSRSCDNEATNKVLLVANGVFQGIGVLSIVGGFLMPETRVVRKTATNNQPKPTIHIAPARIGYQGYGLAAFGTF